MIRHSWSAWAFKPLLVELKVIKSISGTYATTTSSMTMEVKAVKISLEWLQEQTFTHICMLSDSMSMIQKIKAGYVRRQWMQVIRNSSIQKLTFIFVPGHAGVKSNERADALAGNAAIENGSSMDRSDIINALRDNIRSEDFNNEDKGFSLSRLHKLCIPIDAARREKP